VVTQTRKRTRPSQTWENSLINLETLRIRRCSQRADLKSKSFTTSILYSKSYKGNLKEWRVMLAIT
jgi:hypothetical protein